MSGAKTGSPQVVEGNSQTSSTLMHSNSHPRSRCRLGRGQKGARWHRRAGRPSDDPKDGIAAAKVQVGGAPSQCFFHPRYTI
jgi:hypothetical protein